MFENLVSNPEAITFPILFVGLLVYVMKTNDVRERQYRDTIDRQGEQLSVVKTMDTKLDKVTSFINKRENKGEG